MVNGKSVFINGKKHNTFLFENGDLYNELAHKISTGAKSHVLQA